jgi:hypothetical protein
MEAILRLTCLIFNWQRARMKTRRDFVPVDHEELCAWLQNLNLKFTAIASSLGFSAPVIAAAVKDIEWAIYYCQMISALRGESTEAVENFDLALFSVDQSANAPVQSITTPNAPAGGPPKRGILRRIRALIQNIKDAAGYTDALGADMRILPTVTEADLETVQPEGMARARADFEIEITWNKMGFQAVRVRRRKLGAGSWTDLGLRTAKKFKDTPPQSAPNQSDSWEYELIFTVKDANVGQWSNTLKATTQP